MLQFHGCYWHGCPKCYKPDDINNDRKCMMKELNNKTNEISNKIKKAGYKLIEIYECNWKNLLDLSKKCNIEDIESNRNKNKLKILKNHIDNLDIEYYKPLNPRDALYGGRTGAVKLYCKVGNMEFDRMSHKKPCHLSKGGK